MLCLNSAKKKLTLLFWDLLLPVWNGNLASPETAPSNTGAIDCKVLEEDSVQGLGDENEVNEQSR